MRAAACAAVVFFLLAGCAERARPRGAAGAPEDVGRQIDRLADPDADERFRARWAIANVGAPAIPHLIEALGDENPHVRQEAAAALGGMFGTDRSEAVPALAKLAADPEPEVRAAAVEALACIGPPARAAGPALAKALGDEDVRTRRGASAALVRVLGDDAVPHLTEALADDRAQPFAAAALGRLGPAARLAAPELERLAREGDPSVRLLATQALGRIRRGGDTETANRTPHAE
ncbi:MAG TPA: HEAT repeat domain-containing protein [Gemmataceae bacterium]|nr:HEAT repeat domain-containing protein [Gemmataceae bacterium]